MPLFLIFIGVIGCAACVSMLIVNLKRGRAGYAALMGASVVLNVYAAATGFWFL